MLPAVARRPLVILKTGSTLPSLAATRGDYEDWIAEGMGVAGAKVCRVAEGDPLPAPEDVGTLVITGSSALVTDRLPWSEATAGWLPEVLRREVPVLGICYGHQLLAHALGGAVGTNPRGREIGSIDVELTPEGVADPLLGGRGPTLVVSASHRQSVLTLPPGARRLAGNAKDPNQAFALGERTWAVQFHPEWDHDVVRVYVEERADALRAEGLDPDALAQTRPSEDGPAILRRFAELAG
jgi:GMP synthase (glutamine-hydrolysing)